MHESWCRPSRSVPPAGTAHKLRPEAASLFALPGTSSAYLSSYGHGQASNAKPTAISVATLVPEKPCAAPRARVNYRVCRVRLQPLKECMSRAENIWGCGCGELRNSSEVAVLLLVSVLLLGHHVPHFSTAGGVRRWAGSLRREVRHAHFSDSEY